MKLLRSNRRSLLMTWLFSYFSIILVLFCVIVIISGVYEKSINENTNEFNNYVFERVTSSVNDVLLNISNLHLTMIRNKRLTTLLNNQNKNYYRNDQTYEVLDDIKSYSQYMVNTDSLFIYMKDIDSVLSEQGILDSYTYFEIFFDNKKMTYEEWKDILINTNSDIYSTMYCKEGIESIAFIFQFPINNSNAVGAILSNKQYLLNGIEKVEWKSLCDIFVYNTYGNLMLSEKRSDDVWPIPRTIKEIKQFNDNKNKVYISNITVNKDTWKVVTIVEKNIILQKIVFIRYLVISVIIICSFLLVILVAFFIKHNYHPIKVFMELFGVQEKRNEYEVLYENINNMIKKNKTLLDSAAKKDVELKTIALAKVITGKLSQNKFSEYGISFGGDYFSVLIFEISNLAELFQEDLRMTDSERKYHLGFMINNIFEEIFDNRDMEIHITDIDDMIVGLISLKTNADLKQIKEIATTGVNFINGHFDISLTYALSGIQTGVKAIPQAYVQALETMNYKKVLFIEEPMCYSEISSGFANSYIFNLHKEQSIINSIKSGKADSAGAIIKNIFDYLEQDKTLALDYITFLVIDILTTITKTANEIMPESFSFDAEAEIYKSIKSGETLSNIFQKINAYLEDICDKVNSNIKNNKGQERIHEITNYINQNYSDMDINVTTIGYHFDLAPSYISKIFKEKTGISLVDYINRLRMAKAQELISDGKYSINDISKMVGFSNERTFYRIYRKYNIT